jgi:hypothetical protein
MALGIQKRSATRIPKPTDPKRVWIREVSNLHMRNFITTGGAVEFCTAKIAIPMTTKKADQ